MNKQILKAIAAAGMIITLSTPIFANAAVENVKNGWERIVHENARADSGTVDSGNDKGYWIRGKRDGNVISEYKNYKKEGFASVINGDGHYREGGWKSADVFSKAEAYWSFWGTNKAKYRFR